MTEEKKPIEHTPEQLAFIELVQQRAFPQLDYYFTLQGTGVFALNTEGDFEFIDTYVAFNVFLKGIEYAKQQ